MSAARAFTRADDRPRVHLWPSPTGACRWSVGPNGFRSAPSPTAGAAVNEALHRVGPVPGGAVIIMEAIDG